MATTTTTRAVWQGPLAAVFRPPALLFGLPLAWRLIGLTLWPFDGLYGQDAFAYYDYARTLWQSLGAWQAPPPFFWPIGYPALVAALLPLAGFGPAAGQIVSLLAGAFLPLLVYRLTRDLSMSPPRPPASGGRFPPEAGGRGGLPQWAPLLAGALVAVCGQLWQSSIVVMSDAAALAWATLAAWAAVRYARGGRVGWLIAAAVALALALITRWVYGLLLLPLAGYLVWAWGGAKLPPGRPSPRPSPDRGRGGLLLPLSPDGERGPGGEALPPARRLALHLLLAAGVGLLVLFPQLLLSASNPDPVLGHGWLTGWRPQNAWQREFVTMDGRAVYPLPQFLFWARALVSPGYLLPIFSPLIGLGAIWVVRDRRRWGAGLLLGGWFLVMFGFLVGIPYQNFRFALAYLPPAAILAALGAGALIGWLGRPSPRPSPAEREKATQRVPGGEGRRGERAVPLLALICALGLVASVIYSAVGVREFVARKAADLATARWAEQQAAPSGRLLAFGLTLTLRHYTRPETLELYNLTPERLGALLADGRPTYLILDLANVQSQWPGRSPEVNYRWLRDGPGLVELGRSGGYTLYRVGAGA